MTGKRQIEDARVRGKIREALELAGGYGRTEEPLLEDVNHLLGGDLVAKEQLGRCLEWNLSKDYVRSEEDEDLEETRWFLTPHGKAKQNESTK